jgi:protein ImuB
MGEVGVTRIAHLLALPRPSIAARFGDAALQQVDRALGDLPEIIEPVRPVAPPCAARAFEGPCSCLTAIGLACRGLLERLCEELSHLARGATECRVTLDRSDMEPLQLDLRLSAASRDPAHLWSLLRPRLERAHLGFGVEGISVTALRVGLVRQEQQRWWATAEPAAARGAGFGQLLDTLVNRLGHTNVARAILVESHIPERACRMVSVLDPGRESAAGVVDADRPSMLLPEPIPCHVIALTPDGPVSRFTIGGEEHGVKACLGPERIASEWWRRERFTRDYFKAQDDAGRWVWIFRDLDSCDWFLHGVWA